MRTYGKTRKNEFLETLIVDEVCELKAKGYAYKVKIKREEKLNWITKGTLEKIRLVNYVYCLFDELMEAENFLSTLLLELKKLTIKLKKKGKNYVKLEVKGNIWMLLKVFLATSCKKIEKWLKKFRNEISSHPPKRIHVTTKPDVKYINVTWIKDFLKFNDHRPKKRLQVCFKSSW